MRVVLRTLFATCICVFLANEVSSLSSTIVGDILIKTQDNGLIYCDSLICPKETAQCHVTKRNDPNDFKTIIRHRSCIALNGDTLLDEKINEQNIFLSNININVSSGGSNNNINGRPMTPEEKKEFDELMEKTKQNVQSQLQTSLGPLLDGSFAANLQNQIQNNLNNAFSKWN